MSVVAEDEKWFAVSLRLFGDTLDPERVQEITGLTPNSVSRKGVPRSGKQGRVYAPAATNVWVFNVKAPEDIGFEQQIQQLLMTLGERREALRTLLATPGIEGELFCGFSSGNGQGGDTIKPETLRIIAELGLSLTLDLYSPTIEGNDELEQVENSEPGA